MFRSAACRRRISGSSCAETSRPSARDMSASSRGLTGCDAMSVQPRGCGSGRASPVSIGTSLVPICRIVPSRRCRSSSPASRMPSITGCAMRMERAAFGLMSVAGFSSPMVCPRPDAATIARPSGARTPLSWSRSRNSRAAMDLLRSNR